MSCDDVLDDPLIRRRLAVHVGISEVTLTRALRGQAVRPATMRRVKRALLALGLGALLERVVLLRLDRE